MIFGGHAGDAKVCPPGFSLFPASPPMAKSTVWVVLTGKPFGKCAELWLQMFALFALVNRNSLRGDTLFATSCEWDNDLFARLWANEGSGWQFITRFWGLTVPTFSLCGSRYFRGPKRYPYISKSLKGESWRVFPFCGIPCINRMYGYGRNVQDSAYAPVYGVFACSL